MFHVIIGDAQRNPAAKDPSSILERASKEFSGGWRRIVHQRRSSFALLGISSIVSRAVLLLIGAVFLLCWFLVEFNTVLIDLVPSDFARSLRVVGPVLALVAVAGQVPIWRSPADPDAVIARIRNACTRPAFRMSFTDADAEERILSAVDEVIDCLGAAALAGGADTINANPGVHPVVRRHLLKADEELRKAKLRSRRYRGEDALSQNLATESRRSTDAQLALEIDELVARALQNMEDALSAHEAARRRTSISCTSER